MERVSMHTTNKRRCTTSIVAAIGLLCLCHIAYAAELNRKCAQLEWLDDGVTIINNCTIVYGETTYSGSCRKYTTGDDTSTCFKCIIKQNLETQHCVAIQHTPPVTLSVEMVDSNCTTDGGCQAFGAATTPGTHGCHNITGESTQCGHADTP